MLQREDLPSFLSVDIKTKWFLKAGERIPALGRILFSLTRGESVAIMGPSGIGKSTLLKVIAGLEPHFDGAVSLEGSPVRFGAGDVQLVFQDDRLFDPQTALENVCFGLPESTDPATAIAEGRKWLKRLRILDRQREYPIRLSGGERKRVALARALINLPKVLLLDEPLASLDVEVAAAISRDILSLAQANGVTLIVTTHNPVDALAMADRALFMADSPATIRSELDHTGAREDADRFATLHAEIRRAMGV